MSNTLSGDPDVALRALLAMQAAAVGAGATRIIVNLEVEDRAVPDVEFVQALAQALGPSYRVSLLDNDGAIQAMFGTVSGGRAGAHGDPVHPLIGRARARAGARRHRQRPRRGRR